MHTEAAQNEEPVQNEEAAPSEPVPSVADRDQSRDRSERGAGTIEWLGISALSIGVLVALFSALESLGLRLIESIGGQLGL